MVKNIFCCLLWSVFASSVSIADDLGEDAEIAENSVATDSDDSGTEPTKVETAAKATEEKTDNSDEETTDDTDSDEGNEKEKTEETEKEPEINKDFSFSGDNVDNEDEETGTGSIFHS